MTGGRTGGGEWSRLQRPPSTQWSEDVAKEETRYGEAQMLRRAYWTGKAEHASCGQGQGLPDSRQWMVKTGVTRADSGLHLGKQVSTRNELNCDVPIVI